MPILGGVLQAIGQLPGTIKFTRWQSQMKAMKKKKTKGKTNFPNKI